jgi:uncharacterized integral membrane protein
VRRAKALFWVLLALPMAGLGVWFVQDNSALVSLVLLGFPLGELPLGIWLTLTFLVGVLSAVLATVPALGAASLRQRRLEREDARIKTVAKRRVAGNVSARAGITPNRGPGLPRRGLGIEVRQQGASRALSS